MADDQSEVQNPVAQTSTDVPQELEVIPVQSEEIEIKDVNALDVSLQLTDDQEKEIVAYLEENLPNMRPSVKEEERIKSYLAMYEMSVKKRNFPYEGAPSQASSDAHDKLNEWLDKAETAFLRNLETFAIDRDDNTLSEESVRRMESTFHKKFFIKSGFGDDLRLILFEAGFLGTSVVAVRENYNISPVREKVVIKDDNDLMDLKKDITEAQYKSAQKAISQNKIYITERDILKVINIGPKANRINLTRFWYPRNAPLMENWDVVSEQEFYTKSDLLAMVEQNEMDKDAVDHVLAQRKQDYKKKQEYDDDRVGEDVKPHALDSNWAGDMKSIKQRGDAYDDEFAVYRVTMKYRIPTGSDPNGRLRSWIQVMYCPAGSNILSASFCQGELPYYFIRYRPVPYKAQGVGIAQQRFNSNCLDSDLKSMFLATLEQEIGSPLLLRKNSSMWASGFRTYPGAVTQADDINNDAKFLPFPEKSRLAVEGMKIILSSSPGVNAGAGYMSGRREQMVQGQKDVADQSRMHSIAVDIDKIANAAWKIYCRLSKLNTDDEKIIDWVYKEKPVGLKMYILESEMNPSLIWTSVLSAITLSPDSRFQQAMMDYKIFHQDVPVSVNDPGLSIQWLNYLASFRPEMDEENRKRLLPNAQTFQSYQQGLGAQGAQAGGALQNMGGPPIPTVPPFPPSLPSTPLINQSPSTPFRGPPQGGGAGMPSQR